tara:strand:- start:265 stop:813 length:549 start_codon:yes stop_codon:yes gene_type:complete
MPRQIENRNFLSPTGFKFTLNNAPKVSFFCNQANIPDLNLGVAVQPTYLKDIDQPGDKLTFGDLTLKFLVDEDLKNYMEIQNWLRGLGYPESLDQIYEYQKTGNKSMDLPTRSMSNMFSDGTLQILSSSFITKFQVKFRQMFPYSLTTLDFDATANDIEYFTASVSFKYLIYDIEDLEGNPL